MAFQRYNEQIVCWYSRLSFPHIWEPEPVVIQGQAISEPRFSTLVILHDEIAQRIQAIEEKLISQSWPHWVNSQPPKGITLRRALQRGDTIRPGDPYLAGKWILSANAKRDSKPWVVVKDPATGNYLPLEDRSRIYSGCEVHVAVGIYTTQIQATAPQIDVGLNGLEVTPTRLPSFENRVSAEQALSGGPDIAAPPPPPGGADVTPPDYSAQTAAAPFEIHPPAYDQPPASVDPEDPMNW